MFAPSSRSLFALGVALLGAAVPSQSFANGRFPSSNYFVVGPGPESRVLALRTTFGLATSYDAGRSWAWVCEEALDAVGSFDASMSIGFDGTVVVGTPRGITISRSGCSWGSPRGNPMRAIVDVANDATGRYMVTAIGPNGVDDQLVLSDDGGASWTTGARIPDFFTETVEMAPSRPSRLYVSGFVRGGIAVLRRSDDGGMTTTEVARDAAFLSGSSSFVAAVDPHDPDVVYVRSAAGFGTMLLRSDDGGRTFRELTRTADQMVGFALSDDGGTVWVASASRAEGILRSVRGGPFTRVAAMVTARCLRQHAGVLYVCTDEAADGYLLGSSIDGGDHIDPLMSGRLLNGVSPACDATTQVGMVCGPLWPAQRAVLATIDAGAPPMLVPRDVPPIDLGGEVGADATDDAPRDVSDASDGTDATVGPDVSDAVESPDVSDVAVSPDARDVTDGSDVVIATDAPVDVPLDAQVDVLSDAQTDVIAAADRGTAPPDDGCSCRAGATDASGAWAKAAAMLGALAWRRRRRAAKPRSASLPR